MGIFGKSNYIVSTGIYH